MIETTGLFSLFLLFWKNLEAHCFHSFQTDSPTKQSENSENRELPDSSKKIVKIGKTVLSGPHLYQFHVILFSWVTTHTMKIC
jgi:hypothetical protein